LSGRTVVATEVSVNIVRIENLELKVKTCFDLKLMTWLNLIPCWRLTTCQPASTT
jgi:hypothetical protein